MARPINTRQCVLDINELASRNVNPINEDNNLVEEMIYRADELAGDPYLCTNQEYARHGRPRGFDPHRYIR